MTYPVNSQGINWSPVSSIFQNIKIDNVGIDHENRIFVGTNGYGIYRSTDSGITWQNMGLLDYNFNSIAINSNDVIFVATDLGIFRSINHGEEWNESDSLITHKLVHTIAINSSNEIFAGNAEPIAGLTGSIYKSTDNGNSWTELMILSNGCHVLAINKMENIFASTLGYKFRSTNNGVSWTEISIPISVHCFAFDSTLNIYAGGYGLWKSTDNGNYWINTMGNLPPGPPNKINSILITKTGVIFVSYSNGAGIWGSTDDGISWQDYSSNIADKRVVETEIDKDGYLYACTFTGLWKSTNSLTTIRDSTREALNSFQLYQNYPNPFNSITTITYQISKPSFVNLSIFDILGNKVSELTNEEKNAGTYKEIFNGNKFVSGVYICRLKSDTFTKSKKIILLK